MHDDINASHHAGTDQIVVRPALSQRGDRWIITCEHPAFQFAGDSLTSCVNALRTTIDTLDPFAGSAWTIAPSIAHNDEVSGALDAVHATRHTAEHAAIAARHALEHAIRTLDAIGMAQREIADLIGVSRRAVTAVTTSGSSRSTAEIDAGHSPGTGPA
jgi:predicted XRE-type DNA-binding protein